MTLWHFIIFLLACVAVLFGIYYVAPRLIASERVRRWLGGGKFWLLALSALLCIAAGPRIENFEIRNEKNGCKFASFKLTGGDPGRYYLTCNSVSEFPRFYLPPDMWIAVTIINYTNTASYANVPLYTNFNHCNFRLELIP